MLQVFKFMQSEDKNGTWLEWYDEIERGESEFDKQYVLEVLNQWYDESGDAKYITYINKVLAL